MVIIDKPREKAEAEVNLTHIWQNGHLVFILEGVPLVKFKNTVQKYFL